MGLSIKKDPFEQSTTVSVPTTTTQDIILNPNKPILLKSLTINLGATTVLNSITINGISITPSTNIDFVNVYGDVIYLDGAIVVNVTNNNTTSAENTTVEIKGVSWE